MTTYYRSFVVVEPHGASAAVIMAKDALSAAHAFGDEHGLGGKWVAVQPLSGIGCERDAKWERIALAGPDCTPSIDTRGQP
jgi:hypothetical protein